MEGTSRPRSPWSPFCRSEWPEDWPLIVGSVARYYGGGFGKAERLTLSELRWQFNLAVEIERRAAEAAKG